MSLLDRHPLAVPSKRLSRRLGFPAFGKISIVAASLLCLGGCLLPSSGPYGSTIRAQVAASVPYALIPLTAESVKIIAASEPNGLAGAFRDRRPPSNPKIGIGDVLGVTIFEAAAGGLFIPAEGSVRPGNFVTLPDQAVDHDGNITVPYAGAIRAAGRFSADIQNDIVKKIADRAIQPQAVVTLSQQRTNLISVIGEVNTPTRFAAAVSGAGDKVTDALARAGGIKSQGYETWVVLERNNRRAEVPFENLITNPLNNIFVQPGDQIYVYRQAQKFIAFGAAGQQGEFEFSQWRITLAEAVAKAGGLVDAQADPASVFLYRSEPIEVAKRLGVDTSKFVGERFVPVVFSASFRDPGGYFLATHFVMRNQDVVFIANAPSVEVTKFLNLLNLTLQTANNGSLSVVYGAAARYAVSHGAQNLVVQ